MAEMAKIEILTILATMAKLARREKKFPQQCRDFFRRKIFCNFRLGEN
jgi:hypothetical protein